MFAPDEVELPEQEEAAEEAAAAKANEASKHLAKEKLSTQRTFHYFTTTYFVKMLCCQPKGLRQHRLPRRGGADEVQRAGVLVVVAGAAVLRVAEQLEGVLLVAATVCVRRDSVAADRREN